MLPPSTKSHRAGADVGGAAAATFLHIGSLGSVDGTETIGVARHGSDRVQFLWLLRNRNTSGDADGRREARASGVR